MERRTSPRELLVAMLREAAELEHALLNSYLFAACSLKSTPQEWAEVDGQTNMRRAPQFERVRLWKQNILSVAHEEMSHLHYVQCLLRALGEQPHFHLPKRDDEGRWVIHNWAARVGANPPDEKGTAIPVVPLDGDLIRNFVMFESTDALQDLDPFGTDATELYRSLYAFEFALRIEGMLRSMDDGPEKDAIKTGLQKLYLELAPVEADRLRALGAEVVGEVLPLERIKFQSIADLYRNGILPLYEEAFESGWVKLNDRNLVDEQLNPSYAAEGFLPVGPIGRSAKFDRFVGANQSNPLRDYKRVDDIVEEIVGEGEGATLFIQRAEGMLAKVKELGVAGFLKAVAKDAASSSDASYQTPDWLANAQVVRKSHLYTFAMIHVEHEQEKTLSTTAGVSFAAARTPIESSTPEFRKLAAELPAQFNAAYLGMLAWLGRMYEPQLWLADQSRRMAIEMLATWPLMSLAIRPMLEVAGLVECDRQMLFRYGDEDVPMLPVWAQELASLYAAKERSEEINAQMDRLIVRTLKGVASWADGIASTMATGPQPDPRITLVLTRLRALSRLSEFERQFPYRVAGGYSDREPNLTYQNTHPDAEDFAEAPGLPDGPLFADTLVARIRFRGWGLVQLATDPDPPTDEVGVSGTHMLHPADGDRKFDRALVWQDYDKDLNIRRDAPDAPPLGVRCCEIALLAPDHLAGATAGYVPLGKLNSKGAVQASGTQQDVAVRGLNLLERFDEHDIAAFGGMDIFLESKGDVRPFLNGENHLVWQDGEPIDPFIISVVAGSDQTRLLSREVFNKGRTIQEMEPYQRLLTSRGPCGFDRYSNLPAWARTPEVDAMLSRPGYPMSYLNNRSQGLIQQLATALAANDTGQQPVDEAISTAERLARVAQPRGTTVAWLAFLLHYGHTVSGPTSEKAAPDALLQMLGKASGLTLALPDDGHRDTTNGRWLAAYTKGLMDTDTLSDFVYGELYVPLRVTGTSSSFERSWSFPLEMDVAVRSYALAFSKPFWAPFKVDKDVRSTQVVLKSGTEPVTLSEHLLSEDADSYTYEVALLADVKQVGEFSLKERDARLILKWKCEVSAATSEGLVTRLAMLAEAAAIMGQNLAKQFAPT